MSTIKTLTSVRADISFSGVRGVMDGCYLALALRAALTLRRAGWRLPQPLRRCKVTGVVAPSEALKKPRGACEHECRRSACSANER